MRKLKLGQTVAVDFKQLRYDQTLDSMGRHIPLTIERGQTSWTMMGADNNTRVVKAIWKSSQQKLK